MQFKLLNFHKFVGNFATSLVGNFIPLMIYKTTGSLRLSVVFMIGHYLCRFISNHLFKKLYKKYPQVSLLLRIIPLLIYNISLIFLEKFMVIGLILITVSYGTSLSFKNNSYDIILNYSSQKKSSKKIVLTRIVESLSAVIACITGGLFIDWNQTILIIFSISLYLISVTPLFIYFIIKRKSIGFNKDFTSNAVITYDTNPVLKQKRQKLVKNFIFQYLLFYTLLCIVDNFTSMYTLHLFISVPTFAKAGYLTAMFQLSNLLGVLAIKLISKKCDLKTANTICGFICAIPICIIPFIQNYLSIYLLMLLFGFTYAICSYFLINTLMSKCKIISATNKALIARQDGVSIGHMLAPISVLIFNSITHVFFVMSCALLIYSIYTNIMEEKLRKDLVNYLQNNEIE